MLGRTDCHSQCAHWLGNDILSVQLIVCHCGEAQGADVAIRCPLSPVFELVVIYSEKDEDHSICNKESAVDTE